MDVLYFGFVILQVFPSVLSYGTGAPASACADMMPRHNGIPAQTEPSPYTIETSSLYFEAGKPITVVIKGPNYKGVLLEARSGSDTTALGTWQTPPANTKFLRCSGNDKGAITHANTNIKNESNIYSWIPPATDKSIVIMATVAQEREIFWVRLKSSNMSRSGGTSLDVSNSADRTVTALAMIPLVLLANLQYLVA